MSERKTSRAARFRRLAQTPVSDLLGGRISGRANPLRQLEEVDLPASARELIRRVVRRTRLWRWEKADVAGELIAHFQDGLEAGATADELIDDFGNEAQAAKLIRRAKKRNRPLVWRGMVRSLQGVAGVIGVYILLMGWFVLGEPDLSVDYLAKINAAAHAVPEEERAWPIYRELLLDHGLHELDLKGVLFREQGGLVRPGDAQWPEAAAFLSERSEMLDLIREGASRSGLGLPLTYSPWLRDEADRQALHGPNHRLVRPEQPPERKEMWERRPVHYAGLPHLPHMRKMGFLMAVDMRLASVEGDASRVLANMEAIIGLARQTQERPMTLNQVVGGVILTVGFQHLGHSLAERPDLLTKRQLVSLAHTLASLDEFEGLDWTGHRYGMLDLFQRIYDRNGHVTDEGFEDLINVYSFPSKDHQGRLSETQQAITSGVSRAALPLMRVLLADRAEMLEQYEQLMSMHESHMRRPLWERLGEPSPAIQTLREWASSPQLRIRYWPLVRWMQGLDAASWWVERSVIVREALLVGIALEVYRRDEGAYPDDLSALVPHYLPGPAVDPTTGEPMLYRIVDGQPVLYARGRDGDDDGGVPGPMKTGVWRNVPESGDWVLFPYSLEVPKATDEEGEAGSSAS